MTSHPAVRPAVSIEGLRVVRGGHLVLRDISLTIERGTVTGLLGPSGCGKTTLMRAIVGVQRVEAGTVTALDAPAGAPALRHQVGYVTQAPAVYRDLSVHENLEYFASILGASRSRISAVVDAVGLRGFEGRVTGSLSGGQLARVSLATALLNEPPLLVLDEPTVGLDPVLRVELWRQFHELANAGSTLLVSSHVMDEAARCDDLILMRDGAILAQASPAALLELTGASDIEGAFLELVRGTEGEAAAASPGGTP